MPDGKQRQSLAQLRDRLVGLAGRGDSEDAVRAGAAAAGRQVARNIDRYWRASSNAETGPIDVIDMFSGCGGMSAGFRAFNALLPTYNSSGSLNALVPVGLLALALVLYAMFVPGRRHLRAEAELGENRDDSDDDVEPPELGDVVDLESRRRGAR